MGCPDWPKCFGRFIPPTKVSELPLHYEVIYKEKLHGEVEFNATKTWIEYINRLKDFVDNTILMRKEKLNNLSKYLSSKS